MTETNAERLEQIKQIASSNTYENAIGTLFTTLFKDDSEWLIEQAERVQELVAENTEIRKGYQERSKRVQELEKDIRHYSEACKAWEAVESYGRKENARLREALSKIHEIALEAENSDAMLSIHDISFDALEGTK